MSSMEILARSAVACSIVATIVRGRATTARPMSANEQLRRQWQMLAAISTTRRGLTLNELMDTIGISKATAYRYVRIMQNAGLPVANERGRFRLLSERELPPAGLSALQIASLQLARMQLESLRGAPLVAELDQLISQLKEPVQQIFTFAPSNRLSPGPDVVKTIERAHRSRRRATIEYRAASRGGTPTVVNIEPLLVNVSDGDPYVRAYCVEREAERTYKLARIGRATLTDVPATYRPPTSPIQAFAHSVKAWSGEAQRVRIRLDRQVAWMAREYPLPGQTESPNPDGSVTIDASVAGLVEAQRRVLAWGSAAEVLGPDQLRKAVRDELAAALGRYDGPGPARIRGGSSKKSTQKVKRSLTDHETKVG